MILKNEFQSLLKEYGDAKQNVVVGDKVLGFGVSKEGRFVELAKVVSIDNSSATLELIKRYNIDSDNQPTTTWTFDKGEGTLSGVPIDQFLKPIRVRMNEE